MPIASVISGASNLLGNLLSNKSQRDTNQANLKIAQMNNEWSERMMDKQNRMNIDQWEREVAYNNEMWQKTNEYNSAKAQAERFKEAGLNPALLMGQNAGTASAASAPSGKSVGLPSPSSATIQPMSYDGISSAVESALTLSAQLQQTIAQTDFINTQKDVLAAESKAKLAKFAQETRGLKWNNDFNEAMESVKAATENEQYLNEVNKRLMTTEQTKLLKQTQVMNDIQITNLPDKMKAEISLMIAQAENLTTSEFGKELKYFEKRFGQKISKSDLRIIFDVWKQDKYSLKYGSIPDLISGGISGAVNRAISAFNR